MPGCHAGCARTTVLVWLLLGAAGCASATPSRTQGNREVAPLARRYVEGETSRYVMTGLNQGREHTINYTAEAESLVKRDEQGRFFEEFRWTKLSMMGQDIPLDEHSAKFRQRVSLDGHVDMTPPDISGLNPMLIGPVFDLMTFYVDLHPSLHQGRLQKPGDEIRVAHGQPNSWADGNAVIIGEDCIDFQLVLKRVDEQSAALNVRHVPPERASVKLPAEWMQERVNPSTPNNWVQVQRNSSPDSGEYTYVAAAGHEVFDVLIELERPSGRIVSATMENPVDVIQRHCRDESLSDCGEPVKYRIRRHIELRLLR